jgi:hypothetical protein
MSSSRVLEVRLAEPAAVSSGVLQSAPLVSPMPENTGRSYFSQCTRIVGGFRDGHRTCSDLEIAEYQRL